MTNLADQLRRMRAFASANRTAVIVLAGIAGAVIFSLFVTHKSERELAGEQRKHTEKYSIALEKPVLRGFNKDGEKVWEIKSGRVELSTDEDKVIFTDADCVFYDKGKENLKVKVGRLEYSRASQDMHLMQKMHIVTAEKVQVDADDILWNHYRAMFVFPKGVKLVTADGNTIRASYMQSDKKFYTMEYVGNVTLDIRQLKDTKFIEEREITTQKVNYKEFKDVFVTCDQVVYDKVDNVAVAQSRKAKKRLSVTSPVTGQVIKPEDYSKKARQVHFKKGDIELDCDSLEARIDRKWAKCTGKVTFVINASKAKKGDTKALKVMRRYRTVSTTEDMEYYWGEDYATTFSPTKITQRDKYASADNVTYSIKDSFGENRKSVYLRGHVKVVQTSGKWMEKNKLVENIKNPDVRRTAYQKSTLSADEAVIFLNNNEIQAAGSVKTVQKDKQAVCDRILYVDREKKFLANGNVVFKNKNKEEFRGEQVIFWSDKDQIEVNGRSAARIKIPEKYRQDLEDARKRIHGEKVEKKGSASEKPAGSKDKGGQPAPKGKDTPAKQPKTRLAKGNT